MDIVKKFHLNCPQEFDDLKIALVKKKDIKLKLLYNNEWITLSRKEQ